MSNTIKFYLFILSLFFVSNLQAQDTLRVRVATVKTDTTYQVRIKVNIDSGWTIKEPVIDICCFSNSRSAIRKIQHIGGYEKQAIFVIHILLVDLKDEELRGSIKLIACQGENCMEPDTRQFKIKLK